MRFCAFNTGTDHHLLDHIAPLASLEKMPLIVTEEKNAELARLHYPEVELRYWPDLEFRLKEIAEEFDTLLESKFWRPELKASFRWLYNKEMRLIFCPHGQSDKGYATPLLAPYVTQDTVLLYGDLLKQMLLEMGIWKDLKGSHVIGNYRLHYFQKEQTRLRLLAQEAIWRHLDPQKRTLLYAPTWRDADGATSFFERAAHLLNESQGEWNIVVKLHPLLSQREPALFHRIMGLKLSPHVCVVEEFPSVYPILERVDAYLGDSSSVGYDALGFDIPLFFFPTTSTPGRLHRCGQMVEGSRNLLLEIEQKLEKANEFRLAQQALYKKAFSSYSPLRGGKTKSDLISPISPAAGSAVSS